MSKTEKVRNVELPAKNVGKLKFLGGSNSDDFNNVLANNVLQCLWYGSEGKYDVERQTQVVLATLIGLKPQDELEGMLLGQMIGCHYAAMECFKRAMIPNQSFEGRQSALNYANKLTRTYATQLEALDKHRGKGQQKVTVEHVHVHQGGQAIVGTVHTGAGGDKKSEDQVHATSVSHAPEQAMRSAFETDGEAVPVASDEERKV